MIKGVEQMSDNKYLNDGRKVAVIGQINNQETIVQEIFVTDSGDEIPSGERFVVKSLHDEPVQSYKDRKLKELDKRIADYKKSIKKIENEFSRMRRKMEVNKDILKSSEKLQSLMPDQELERLTMFMSGSVEYVVIHGYKIKPPVKFEEAMAQRYDMGSSKRYEGIKLLSLLGESDGNLSYRLNMYRDGSGGWHTIMPFKSYQEAVDYVAELAGEKIYNDKLSEEEYQTCLDIGIEFSLKNQKRYKENLAAKARGRIESYQKQIARQEELIEQERAKIV